MRKKFQRHGTFVRLNSMRRTSSHTKNSKAAASCTNREGGCQNSAIRRFSFRLLTAGPLFSSAAKATAACLPRSLGRLTMRLTLLSQNDERLGFTLLATFLSLFCAYFMPPELADSACCAAARPMTFLPLRWTSTGPELVALIIGLNAFRCNDVMNARCPS